MRSTLLNQATPPLQDDVCLCVMCNTSACTVPRYILIDLVFLRAYNRNCHVLLLVCFKIMATCTCVCVCLIHNVTRGSNQKRNILHVHNKAAAMQLQDLKLLSAIILCEYPEISKPAC